MDAFVIIGVLSIVVLITLLVIFVIIPAFAKPIKISETQTIVIPSGECKCLSDMSSRSPASSPFDQAYQSIEQKDNSTFCGFEQGGYRWACKPSDCTPVCV
jgi:hypothetical protein